MRLIDAYALYNGAMKDEYFDFKAHDKNGRESFAYSCAMQRLAEAPTVDAIPIEWLYDKRFRSTYLIYEQDGALVKAINTVLRAWEKEQGGE